MRPEQDALVRVSLAVLREAPGFLPGHFDDPALGEVVLNDIESLVGSPGHDVSAWTRAAMMEHADHTADCPPACFALGAVSLLLWVRGLEAHQETLPGPSEEECGEVRRLVATTVEFGPPAVARAVVELLQSSRIPRPWKHPRAIVALASNLSQRLP